MTPGGWLQRYPRSAAAWWRRWMTDPRGWQEWQPELGSDDEPCGYVPTDCGCGCRDCTELTDRIREKLARASQMQRDLAECRAIAEASGMADA